MDTISEWTKFSPKPRETSGDFKWNVFLSYRSVNRPWVLNLYDVLREQGHKVFLDQCVLKAGDRLTGTLEAALTASQAGVLIWSSATKDSEWVRDEYEVLDRQAKDRNDFQFVPVKLDDSDLPAFAKNRVFLDFGGYPDGPNGGELLRLLHAVVGQPLSDEAVHFANAQDEAAKAAAVKIRAATKNGNSERLIELFTEGGLEWETSASLGCQSAESLTKLKRYDAAISMLTAIEQRFSRAIRPKQLHALALARRAKKGDLAQAQEIVGELYAKGERDPETLGIYARTWMDRYEESKDIDDLKQSRDLYAEAFEAAQDDFYTGINAAAKSVFLGSTEDLAQAKRHAEKVQKIVGGEPVPGDYWKTATVAELLLMQRKYEEAGRIYSAAVAMARKERGSHETTWKQARRLMEKLKPSDSERTAVGRAFEHLSQ